ncbi:MAG TPA: hypothetical protein VGR53_08885 [Nitrososphaerales archaeon]|nr:hypothetical protein [Nitrososphaerales archaeon]
MGTANEVPVIAPYLSDPRIERILTIGKEINDLLSKIRAASNYLNGDTTAEDAEEVELARSQLTREISMEWREALELLPSLEETIEKLGMEERQLVNAHKMNVGLARIEGLTEKGKQKRFSEAAATSKISISEIRNLIDAMEALQKDIGTTRTSPHMCPRCTSTKVSYRITPSEFGFTLFRCDECGNAWKITEFSLRAR